MSQQWYFSKGDQKQGPVATEQLKELAASGAITPADLVWKDGMAQWAKAGSVKGLFPEKSNGGPPPLPPTDEIGSSPAPAVSLPSAAGTTMQPAILRQKIEGLKKSLVQHVLSPQADLPAVEPITTFRNEHSQLEVQLKQLQHRLQELGKAKAAYEVLDGAARQKAKELAAAEASMEQFARPLGKAAFEGFLLGQTPEQPVFNERLVLQGKLGELRDEYDRLAPSADAGMLDKTKAKAQQLMVAGKTKVEEMKIGKLEERIGKDLIASKREESVCCEHTTDILAEVAKHRSRVSELTQESNQAREALDKKKQELAQALQIAAIDSSKSFDAERQSCQSQIAKIEAQRGTLEKELPERLLACEGLDAQGYLGQFVRDLRDAKAQLAASVAAEAIAAETAPPIPSRKRAPSTESELGPQEPLRTSGLQRSGGIIALIAGIFSVFAAFATLFIGGVGGAFGAQGADTVVGLGWGGVFFSLATMVLGVVNIVGKTKRPGYWLIGCSILGMILGGGLVAIFMLLALIGGIMAAMGGHRPPSSTPGTSTTAQFSEAYKKATQSAGAITSSVTKRLQSTGLSLEKLPPWARNKWLWIGAACLFLLAAISSNKQDHSGHRTATTTSAQGGSETASTQGTTDASESVSPVTWHEINAIYSLSSGATDLRKDEEWKNYKGKIVKWTGRVEDIKKGFFGGVSLLVKMNPRTMTFDLSIDLKSDQATKAANLRKGETITFKAVLDSWGTLMPITLNDGEIVQ